MTIFNALLVGAGGMGRAWGKNLRDCDEVRLAGWIDLRPDAAAQAADQLGVAGVVTGSDLERALAEIVVGSGGFQSQVEAHVGAVVEDMPTGIAGSLRDFLHALKTGATPMGECHDNIKSLAMVFAAIESAATGQRVSIA